AHRAVVLLGPVLLAQLVVDATDAGDERLVADVGQDEGTELVLDEVGRDEVRPADDAGAEDAGRRRDDAGEQRQVLAAEAVYNVDDVGAEITIGELERREAALLPA